MLAPGSMAAGHQRALAAQLGPVVGNQALQRAIRPPGPRLMRLISVDDAKKRIDGAAGGWGTDEEAIYGAIRDCADRPKLQADPGVQSVLRDELSGHEFWKAQLLLHFGNEAAFPPALKEIWAATKGAGTDEARIFKALQALNEVDAKALATIPGLEAMLQDELSGKDLQAARALLKGDYAQALAAHRNNMAVMNQEIANWRAGADVLAKNTAEWIAPTTAGAKPKNNVYILTPTHDSSARAAVHGEKGKVAYFGTKNRFPDGSATYDAHVDSRRNIHYSDPAVDGEHLGRDIWIMDPANQSPKDILDVTAHEVQHDADRHDTEEGHDESYKSPEESWNRYKTEFRSYWVTQQFFQSDVSGTGTPPWDNAKQEAIFNHMMGSVYAEWLAPNYNKNTSVDGAKFKDLVHGYTKPEGVNLRNSPRIDDFFLALQACRPNHADLGKSPVKELIDTAKLLDADDLAHVNSPEAKRLQEMLKDKLDGGVFAAVALILGGGAVPGWAQVNIAPAKRELMKAAAGWGTDESKINDVLAKASEAERKEMAADKQILDMLSDELSGKELWRARQYLKYGPKANWPEDVKKKD